MRLFLAFLVITSALALAPLERCSREKALDHHYIVLFHQDTAPDCTNLERLQEWVSIRARGAKVLRPWSFSTYRGFHAFLDSNLLLDSIRSLPEVRLVEENCVFRVPTGELWNSSATVVEEKAALGTYWGKYRCDQCSATFTETDPAYPFKPPGTGKGVNVWILDTGVRITHTELAGHATWYWSAYGETTDNNGHGTHCAGIVAGVSTGIAPQTNIYAVQVLNRFGSGTTDAVVSGIQEAVKGSSLTPGVDIISMSLGGGASQALDDAVNAASTNPNGQKIPVIVAAGNDGRNAENTSPCRAEEAICIGATTSLNAVASYSNFGPKVIVLSPGSNIYSSWYTSDTAYNTISGTSMATPAVAGSVAVLGSLDDSQITPSNVRYQISLYSTKNVITGVPSTQNNWLIYDRWGYDENPIGCKL